jgi:hypothetical protein
MNVEIGAEAALFPEKEYINGIAVTVKGIPIIWGNVQIVNSNFRRPLVIYDFATAPSEFPDILYEEKLIFFFISAPSSSLDYQLLSV